VISQK